MYRLYLILCCNDSRRNMCIKPTVPLNGKTCKDGLLSLSLGQGPLMGHPFTYPILCPTKSS
jgi:hypothetical protein